MLTHSRKSIEPGKGLRGISTPPMQDTVQCTSVCSCQVSYSQILSIIETSKAKLSFQHSRWRRIEFQSFQKIHQNIEKNENYITYFMSDMKPLISFFFTEIINICTFLSQHIRALKQADVRLCLYNDSIFPFFSLYCFLLNKFWKKGGKILLILAILLICFFFPYSFGMKTQIQ